MALDELLAAGHSPTPWRIGLDTYGTNGNGLEIRNAEGTVIVLVAIWSNPPSAQDFTDRNRANAELIVAAVNAVALAKGISP